MKALAVSSLLADEYILQILTATWSRALTVEEISKKFDIPIATCYRKIRELEKRNMITCSERIVTREGRSRKKFQSTTNSISIVFHNGELRVDLQLAYQDRERIVEDFREFISPSILSLPS